MKEEIRKIQDVLKSTGSKAAVIFGTDPHSTEFIPHHHDIRYFLTDFHDSSPSVMLIFQDEVYYFANSGYFLQTQRELEGSGIKIISSLTADIENNMSKLLAQYTKPRDKVLCVMENIMISMVKFIESLELEVVDFDINTIWKNRPALSSKKLLMLRDTGLTTAQKIERALKERDIYTTDRQIPDDDGMLLTSLDDIAWVCNMRGFDIPYYPLFYAFMFLSKKGSVLFIDKSKLDSECVSYLKANNVEIKDYLDVYNMDFAGKVYLTFKATNSKLYKSIKNPVDIDFVVKKQKVSKTDEEVVQMREALIQEGVALTELFYYIDSQRDLSIFTEVDIANVYLQIRQKNPNFVGNSFPMIVAYRQNATMGRYDTLEADKFQKTYLKGEGCLAFDLGSQYFQGTTDTSRTMYIGNKEVPKLAKKIFTLTLKGHIALTSAVFHKDSQGRDLYGISKSAMNKEGYTFGHGVSHGVGHFLCVHEHPMFIPSNYPLPPNSIYSNEPCIISGHSEYVGRLEGLILAKKHPEFKDYLCFEAITYNHIEKNMIEVDMLTKEEIKWVNEYHQKVYETLKHRIKSKKVLAYLKEKTQPIHV